MNQEIVIIANGAPYGSESLFNALRLAIALREQGGANLKLFLMSDAVSAALAGQAPAEGYNLRQMLEILLAQGSASAFARPVPMPVASRRCRLSRDRDRHPAAAGPVDTGGRQGVDLLAV